MADILQVPVSSVWWRECYVGDDGIDSAGDEEEQGDIEISNPGLAQRSGAMVMVAGTRLGRGQLAFHQLVILSFREE